MDRTIEELCDDMINNINDCWEYIVVPYISDNTRECEIAGDISAHGMRRVYANVESQWLLWGPTYCSERACWFSPFPGTVRYICDFHWSTIWITGGYHYYQRVGY